MVAGDGIGYYAYLPALFVDYNLGAQDTTTRFFYHFGNGSVNKYFVGEAVLLSPFFGVGYGIAAVFGSEKNGFSEPFMKMISIGALFYLLLGLFFLKKVLECYQVPAWAIALTLLLLTFGTNLLYYTL